MRSAKVVLLSIFMLCLPALCTAADDSVFQVSAISSLMEGDFNGQATVGSLGANGDFGIGTFDALDGEMIVYGGKVYQVKSDGKVYQAADATTTPFAVMKFFKADRIVPVNGPVELAGLQELIDANRDSTNLILAIRITGTFEYMKVRSVPRQSKPYPKLSEAAKGQSVYEYNNVEGTLIGFRFPKYMEGVNVPGYHFHFLSKDGNTGGHLLACRVKTAVAEVDESAAFRMTLPGAGVAVNAPGTYREELERVER